jgi:hypothetical protein
MFFDTAVLLALGTFIRAQDSDVQAVEAVLKNSSVIPDVLPANFSPMFPIEVSRVNEVNVPIESNSIALQVVFPQAGTNTSIPVTAGANLTANGGLLGSVRNVVLILILVTETANMPFFAIQSNNMKIIGRPYLIAIVNFKQHREWQVIESIIKGRPRCTKPTQ